MVFPRVAAEAVGNVGQFRRQSAVRGKPKEATGTRQSDIKKAIEKAWGFGGHLVRGHEEDGFEFKPLNESDAEHTHFGLGAQNPSFQTRFGVNSVGFQQRLPDEFCDGPHVSLIGHEDRD
jgi:hypothetical protein